MVSFLWLLAALVQVVSANRYFTLNKFESDVISSINVEKGSTVYLSSRNLKRYLQNVTIDFGDKIFDAYTLSLLYKSNDGLKQGVQVNSTSITITTNNTDSATSTLYRSYLYILDPATSADPNFAVYDIVNKTTIVADGNNKTLVFFNFLSMTDDPLQPNYSARITFQSISNKSTFEASTNFPADELVSELIFKTPVIYHFLNDHIATYYTNIEPLPIYEKAFTLTFSGAQNFTVDNTWKGDLVTKTTSATTTGLLSSNYNFQSNQVVQFSMRMDHNGTAGYRYYYNVVAPVSAILTGPLQETKFLIEPGTRDSGLGATIGAFYNFSLDCDSSIPGIYYFQYFTLELEPYPVTSTIAPTTQVMTTTVPTTTTKTTTTTMETTTMTATARGFLIAAVISCLFR